MVKLELSFDSVRTSKVHSGFWDVTLSQVNKINSVIALLWVVKVKPWGESHGRRRVTPIFTENCHRGRCSMELPPLSSPQPSEVGPLASFYTFINKYFKNLTTSPKSPLQKWELVWFSVSHSSFPAHAGSCLWNSEVFFYLQNLRTPKSKYRTNCQRKAVFWNLICPLIHADLAGTPSKSHQRDAGWASEMFAHVGSFLVTAGGDHHGWWLSCGLSPVHGPVKLELETSVQRKMLSREQWTEWACALTVARHNMECGKTDKLFLPWQLHFPRAGHSTPRAGCYCSPGCRYTLEGRSLRGIFGLWPFLPPDGPKEWSDWSHNEKDILGTRLGLVRRVSLLPLGPLSLAWTFPRFFGISDYQR